MRGKWTRSRLSEVLLGIILFVVQLAAAQSTPHRTLLALSKGSHTLAMVDRSTLQVIARLPVGPDPHEVIASSDGTKAYVSVYGGGLYHTLSVLDLVAQKALPDIDTGALNGPHGLAFVGGKVGSQRKARKPSPGSTQQRAQSIGSWVPAKTGPICST